MTRAFPSTKDGVAPNRNDPFLAFSMSVATAGCRFGTHLREGLSCQGEFVRASAWLAASVVALRADNRVNFAQQTRGGCLFLPISNRKAAGQSDDEDVRAELEGETLAGLVDNAGIAVAGPVLDLSADEFRRQMDVNVIGPIIATQAFGPLLGADPSLHGPKGRIVMISSVAGKNGNPLMSAYSASKHAIEGLSESLRREMMLFGIDVIIIAPGPVKTPIWAKAEEVDISGYRNSPFFPALGQIRKFVALLGERGLPAEKIGELVHHALTAANPRVRYQISPDPMRHLLTAILPKRMVDRIIARRLGLMPKG
jgi:NAD(P)-dependent dehydrogenase (short-subunit alcohol dehydrogenase family)